MDELIYLGEYKNTKKILVIGTKYEALFLSLLVKRNGICVFYTGEKKVLKFIQQLNKTNHSVSSSTKFLLVNSSNYIIKYFDESCIPNTNYFVVPIQYKYCRN